MIGEHTQEVITRIDSDLLDKQISTLHKVEAGEPLKTDEEQEHITGLCNFLSELHNAMRDDDSGQASSS